MTRGKTIKKHKTPRAPHNDIAPLMFTTRSSGSYNILGFNFIGMDRRPCSNDLFLFMIMTLKIISISNVQNRYQNLGTMLYFIIKLTQKIFIIDYYTRLLCVRLRFDSHSSTNLCQN